MFTVPVHTCWFSTNILSPVSRTIESNPSSLAKDWGLSVTVSPALNEPVIFCRTAIAGTEAIGGTL